MPINVDEIKKLSNKEKLQLVDEILDSVDDAAIKEHLCQEEDEIDNILQERMEAYESGKMKFDSWDNVYRRLLARLKNREQQ